VILPVTDIEAAASFYARVLEVPGVRVSGGRHYFDCDGTLLACYDAVADGDPTPVGPNPQHVYFSVDDVDAAVDSQTLFTGERPWAGSPPTA
jgi:catechol 2,3-dioxygenase-like lactoylglutathione lyase family enzyme